MSTDKGAVGRTYAYTAPGYDTEWTRAVGGVTFDTAFMLLGRCVP